MEVFGFAIWDARSECLMLARDRVELSRSIMRCERTSIVFGSEIKAILTDSALSMEVRPEIVDRFLTFYYVPGEDTLFKDIFKLGQGPT